MANTHKRAIMETVHHTGILMFLYSRYFLSNDSANETAVNRTKAMIYPAAPRLIKNAENTAAHDSTVYRMLLCFKFIPFPFNVRYYKAILPGKDKTVIRISSLIAP